MKRAFPIILVFIMCCPLITLGQIQEDIGKVVDSLYREDQFYFGVTYNLVRNKPEGLSQTGFSSGFQFGFIRDFPINKKRNVAIGIGLGYSTNSVNHNVLVQENDMGGFDFELLDTDRFTKNKFSLDLIELPIEFRWRSSTPELYKFWRVYTGFKIGYVIRSSVKYEGEPENFKIKQVDAFNDFEYGLTLSVGYDKFNIHVYYTLNSIFDENSRLNDRAIEMSSVKIGLMLYIL